MTNQIQGHPFLPEIRKKWFEQVDGTFIERVIAISSDSAIGAALGFSDSTYLNRFNLSTDLDFDFLELQDTDNKELVIADDDDVWIAFTEEDDINIPGFMLAADTNGQHIIASFISDASDGRTPVQLTGWVPSNSFMTTPFQDQPSGSTVSGYLLTSDLLSATSPVGDMWMGTTSDFTLGKPTNASDQIGKIIAGVNSMRTTAMVIPPKHAGIINDIVIMPRSDKVVNFEILVFAPGVAKRGFFPGMTADPLSLIGRTDGAATFYVYSIFRAQVNAAETGTTDCAASVTWELNPIPD